nr:NAD(P)-dependent oxidoreductase [Auraticoccus cholistanensis]
MVAVGRERVLVTGAAGKIGRATVADLLAAGHEVVAVDRVEPAEDLGTEFVRLDGDDLAGTTAAVRGCTALVALASVPHPGTMPPHELFANNTVTPFVALQAAVDAGIRRVALASSGSAYGTAWSPEPTTVDEVPVHEGAPLRNAEEYGLSKMVTEEIGRMFCRRHPDLSVAALRFHWVATREEQLQRIASQRSAPRRWREELRELWGYVDLRDAARACRLAVEAAAREPYGFQAMNVVAADLLADEPLEELLAAHAPQVVVRSGGPPAGGAFSIQLAAEVIGWEPRHSWRDPD